MNNLLLLVLLFGCFAVAACSSEPVRQAEPQPSLDEIWYADGDKPLKLDPRWLVIELREHQGAWYYYLNGTDKGTAFMIAALEAPLMAYADLATDSPMLPGRGLDAISENPVVLRAPPSVPLKAVNEVFEMMSLVKLYRTVLELTAVAEHQALLELPKDESLGAPPCDPAEYVHIRLEAPAADSLRLICSTTDSQTREVDFRPSELFGDGWNAGLYRRTRGSLAKALIALQGAGPSAKSWVIVRLLENPDVREAPYAALVLAFDAIRLTSVHPNRGDRPRLMSGWHFEMFEPPLPPEDETEFPE